MIQIPDPGGTTMGNLFEVIEEIGKGGYGNVYKARERSTGNLYALKKVKTFDPRQATPPSFFRETECLRSLHDCDNILSLHSVFRCHESNCFYLVLELCDCDLSEVIQYHFSNEFNNDFFFNEQIRYYMKQVLTGISNLHLNGFVHRDIKPSNILLKFNELHDNFNSGIIKIADFGLSRNLVKLHNTRSARSLTPRVATLSYRAPELLLGSTSYDQSIDIWSLGCLFFEMATGKVLFRTASNTLCYQNPSSQFNRTNFSEFAQLNKIFEICGTPDKCFWSTLPNSDLLSMIPKYESDFSKMLDSELPTTFLPIKDLLMQMLKLDPTKRITIDDALQHPFFSAPLFSHSSPILELTKQVIPGQKQSFMNYFSFTSSSPLDSEQAPSDPSLSSFSFDNKKNNNQHIFDKLSEIKLFKPEQTPTSHPRKKQNFDLQSLRQDKITPPEIVF